LYHILSMCFFFYLCFGDNRYLHSFPTRRSSDLASGSIMRDCCRSIGCSRSNWPRKVCSKLFVAQTRSAWASTYQFGPCFSRGCRSEEHTSELQSRSDLVCRLLLEKKKKKKNKHN